VKELRIRVVRNVEVFDEHAHEDRRLEHEPLADEGRSDEAWRYLTDELTPTVALLTEARPPASLIEDGRVASPKWTDGRLHRCIDRSRI
jgi:hypothetical protein